MQTVASAAGTLSSIIFVLPGLMMIGWWTGFPYWVSFADLRARRHARRDVLDPAAPRAGDQFRSALSRRRRLRRGAQGGRRRRRRRAEASAESRAGLLARRAGARSSRRRSRCVVATRVFASDVGAVFPRRRRGGRRGFDFSLSFALFGVGHLVGLWVGIAMLVGAADRLGLGRAALRRAAPLAGSGRGADGSRRPPGATRCASSAPARSAWRRSGRWPSSSSRSSAGLRSAMAASRVRGAGQAATLPRTEQDIPIGIVGIDLAAVPAADRRCCSRSFGTAERARRAPVAARRSAASSTSCIMGFFVSAVCGYMAGLIGSSNSPLSGIGILVVIGAALLLVLGRQARCLPAEAREGAGGLRAVRHRGGVRRRRRSPTTTCRT